MPTKKRVIQVVLDDNIADKFKILQKRLNRRYASELASIIISDFITNYENENGKLKED